MTRITDDGRVEFRFFRPGVAGVRIAGDVPGGQLPMRPEPQAPGWWQALARLDAGEYRFLYDADGQLFPDYAAHGVEPTKAGWTSILVVPDARATSAATAVAA